MTDQTDPGAPANASDPDSEPLSTDAGTEVAVDPGVGSANPAATPLPALASVSSAQLRTFWTGLGPIGQLIASASIAVVLIVILGAVVDVWDASGSAPVVLVTAGVAAGLAAWLTARTEAGAMLSPIPLVTIEFAAGVVATLLAALRLISLVFDLDDIGDYGGPIGAILTAALMVAAGAILVGALRRDPTLRSDVLAADRGTRIAVAGLALVVVAWVWNLSIGYWRLSGGAIEVALATFGAVLVIVEARWRSVLPGIPLGWVGAAFGLVSLLLAIGLWGQLMEIGLTRLELGLTDYLPFVLWYLGTVAIIAGGVMAGLAGWQARPAAPRAAPAEPPAAAEAIARLAEATPSPTEPPDPPA